ncbi:MAG TPA: hypothetical protein VF609_02305 [Flavisolibacter sp.]
MTLRKLTATIAFTFLTLISFSQGTDKYDKMFTKYDLYKWSSTMGFKPKNFDTKTFENFLLKMEQQVLDQWHVELVVTYEQYKKGDDAMMFVFKKQLKEYYGNIADDKFNQWYIPYYVFLQLDKWAAEYIQKQKK